MTSRIKYVLLCLAGFVFFLLISCIRAEDYNIVYLQAPDQLYTLNGRDVSIDTNLLNPRHITIVNDQYLIVMENRQEEIFKVFSLPDIHYLYSWGRKGEGPDAFSSISFNFLDSVEDQIVVYLPALRTLQYFEVTDTAFVSKKRYEIGFSGQKQPLNNLNHVRNSLYIATHASHDNSNYEFIALQPDSNNILYAFGDYPHSALENHERFEEYFKTTTVKPDRNKFAAFYLRHNWLRIFDVKGELLRNIKIDEPELSQRKQQNEQFAYRGHQIESTDNHIFTMGLYATYMEIESDPKDFKPTLEIWDWMGVPVSRYLFDKSVIAFTLSDTFEKIYTVNYLEESSITIYDLPN